MQTCRKILHYKTTLKFPADRIRHLSPQSIDFLKALLTDADKRLGAKGVSRRRSWLAFGGRSHSRALASCTTGALSYVCAGGVEEIKAHPWFRGLDWDHLLEAEAPWQPPNGKVSCVECAVALPDSYTQPFHGGGMSPRR